MTSSSAKRTPLLDDRERTDPAYSDDEESTWAFLDRVDDDAFERVRSAMNAWFGRYPAHKVNDIRGRLESNDDVEFHGAWFELYLHELHTQLGFEVTVEPTLPDGGQPDFLVTRDGSSFFLEATIIGDRGTMGRTRRIARVTAAINRTHSPDFWLHVEIEKEGQDAPPMRDVRRRLERWVGTLDWHAVREAQEVAFDLDALPSTNAIAGDWSFAFRAWPRRPEDRGADPGRAIGAYPSDGAAFDHPGGLKERLEDKAAKYPDPGWPVVLAVRLDRLSASADDVRVALMGPSIGRPSATNPRHIERTGQFGTGFFRDESGRWRNRHVAGVLVWDIELRPWSIARCAPTLWLHPEPEHPIGPSLPWSHVTFEGNAARPAPGSFAAALVPELPGIDTCTEPSDWPGRLFETLRESPT
jgi:hypothetical protein